MSRLYYDPPPTTPEFTVGKKQPSEYLEKVARLIPSEIVAAYLALVGLVPLVKTESMKSGLYIACFLICGIMTPIYLNALAEKGKPKRIHLFLSTVAFVVWAYAVSAQVAWPSLYDSAVASMVLIVFTLVSGKIPLS